MSPKAAQLLVSTIAPLIRRVIARGTARTVGAEDREELAADCIAQAARILHAGEANGKELPAKTVVYHALLRTRYGQRGPNKSCTDVMAPRTQFLGRSTLVPMDALLRTDGDDGEPEHRTLHDVLAAGDGDVAAAAARRLDWAEVTRGMDDLGLDILCSMADGRYIREVAEEYGVDCSKVRQRRGEVKSHIRSKWDSSAIADAVAEPSWKKRIRILRERRECRAERAGA
jgi:hypothetical protein